MKKYVRIEMMLKLGLNFIRKIRKITFVYDLFKQPLVPSMNKVSSVCAQFVNNLYTNTGNFVHACHEGTSQKNVQKKILVKFKIDKVVLFGQILSGLHTQK